MESNENNFLKVLEALISHRESEVYKDLRYLVDARMNPPKDTSQSTELNELFIALAKAQSEMPSARKLSDNPFFKSKYADLEEVVNASRPSLTKYGLSVMQEILIKDDGQSILRTILGHSSGQFKSCSMRITPPKSDIQSLGSYLSFLRRYSYSSLIGVVTGDEDDDGEMAMIEARQTTIKTSTNKDISKEQSFEVVTKEQLEEIEYELEGHPGLATEIMEKMRIRSLADLPKSKYMVSINRIREIKNAQSGLK